MPAIEIDAVGLQALELLLHHLARIGGRAWAALSHQMVL